VIGFQILSRSERTADLTADGRTALLTLEQPEGIVEKKRRTTGLYHFALLLPSRADLAQFVLHLASLDVPLGSADHLVSEAIYLSDPDGNGIEVYRDRDPSTWTWDDLEVRMATDPLDFRDLLKGVKDRTWQGLPQGTVMGHIHLHVAELAQTEVFYRALGFEVVSRFGPQALFVSNGKYHHHIGLNTWNGIGAPRPSASSVGLKWFDVIYPDDAARGQAVANLRQLGIAVAEEEAGWMVEDPSGNHIRLIG
jgi:catechol 2,3-dioxygenase